MCGGRSRLVVCGGRNRLVVCGGRSRLSGCGGWSRLSGCGGRSRLSCVVGGAGCQGVVGGAGCRVWWAEQAVRLWWAEQAVSVWWVEQTVRVWWAEQAVRVWWAEQTVRVWWAEQAVRVWWAEQAVVCGGRSRLSGCGGRSRLSVCGGRSRLSVCGGRSRLSCVVGGAGCRVWWAEQAVSVFFPPAVSRGGKKCLYALAVGGGLPATQGHPPHPAPRGATASVGRCGGGGSGQCGRLGCRYLLVGSHLSGSQPILCRLDLVTRSSRSNAHLLFCLVNPSDVRERIAVEVDNSLCPKGEGTPPPSLNTLDPPLTYQVMNTLGLVCCEHCAVSD